jgi:hypothetical protein
MDYHKMSLVELKQAAKEHVPKIKQYYIKSRVELIQILTLEALPESMIIEKKTIDELRKEAQAQKLPGIWKLRRSELVELLYPSSKEDNKDDDHGKEHHYPKERKRKNVGVEVLKDSQ